MLVKADPGNYHPDCDKSDRTCKRMFITGCVQPCPLDDFVRIVSPIVLETDEEHERLCLSIQQNGIGIECEYT